MREVDRSYLKDALQKFTVASLHRVAETGYLSHEFVIEIDELKRVTGRQRLHPEEVTEFFEKRGVNATYDRDGGKFDIALDLTRAKLDPTQADALSTAIQYHREV